MTGIDITTVSSGFGIRQADIVSPVSAETIAGYVL